MSRHKATVAVVAVAVGAGTIASASAAAVVHLVGGLSPATIHDAGVLTSREEAVAAVLKGVPHAGGHAAAVSWAARLHAAEAAQEVAEAKLNADLVAGVGTSATKATAIVLSISDVNVGNKDIQQWKATVRGPSSLAAGEVAFTLSVGARVLATFTTSATDPAQCTITDEIGANAITLQATAPDRCAGGVGGYVDLFPAEFNSPAMAVRATFRGAPGSAPSTSGPVDPMTIASGQTASS